VKFGKNLETTMKKIAIFASELPGETAGVNASPQPGESSAIEPPSPTLSPAVPAPAAATARRAAQGNAPAPFKSGSVVSKVADLLIQSGQNLQLEKPVEWEDRRVRQKLLTLLQVKQPLQSNGG
jgi:hypothetical protein